MYWKESHLKTFKTAKEYVDTVVVPLTPYQMTPDKSIEQLAFQNEILSIFAYEIEKELTGRLLMLPQYTYLQQANKQDELKRLERWVTDLRKQPFKFIFYLTFDNGWRKLENQLDGELLWLPAINNGNIQSESMKQLIKGQAGQLSGLIKENWSISESDENS